MYYAGIYTYNYIIHVLHYYYSPIITIENLCLNCYLQVSAGLVTVDSDAEFEFIKREVRRRVTLAGQELAHEQWWTAGRIQGDSWVWDAPGLPPGKNFLPVKM